MIGKHNLFFNNKIVGTVTITKEGMFYKLQCQYEPFDDKMYCLCHSGFNNCLGLCLPGVTVRVKISDLRPGDFLLKPKSYNNDRKVYLLDKVNPDFILRNITELRMIKLDSGVGVMIKSQVPGLQDSDLNP